MASPDLLSSARPDELPPGGDTSGARRRDGLVWRLVPELAALAVVLVLWPATGGLESSAGGPGPAFFPRVLLGLLGVSALVGVALELLRHRAGRAARVTAAPLEDDAGPTDLRRALFAAAIVLGYVLATGVLGFALASTVFCALFLWLSGQRRWWLLVGVAGIAPWVLTYAFVKVVYIALPTGLGPFDTVTVALYRVFGIY